MFQFIYRHIYERYQCTACSKYIAATYVVCMCVCNDRIYYRFWQPSIYNIPNIFMKN